MKTALSADACPLDTPLDRRFGEAVQRGFGGVALPISSTGPLRFDSPEEDCIPAAKLAARSGLGVVVVVTDEGEGFRLDSPAPEARRAAEDRIRAALERAPWVGAGAVVMPAVPYGPTAGRPALRYEEAHLHALEALLRLRFDAQQRTVRLAFPCGGSGWLRSPMEARDFIDRINSPWVGVGLDVGGVGRVENAADWVRSLGWRLVHLRLGDCAGPSLGVEAHSAPGTGDVDWAELNAALREMRYDGYGSRRGQLRT